MNPPDVKAEPLTRKDRAVKAAGAIARLTPGPAAELRRMKPGEEVPPPAFWMIYHEHLASRPEDWEWVAHALALLTPKGRDPGKDSAHDGRTRLGKALSEAGYSDLRLRALLTAPFARRRAMLLMACRMLAQKGARLDAGDLAALLMDEEALPALRETANAYYGAEAHKKTEKDKTHG